MRKIQKRFVAFSKIMLFYMLMLTFIESAHLVQKKERFPRAF